MLRWTSLLRWITSLLQWIVPIKDIISEREASVSTPKAEWSDKVGTVVNNSLNMNISILWASPVLNFYFSTVRSRIVALYCSALWATFLLLSSHRSPKKSTYLESTLQSLSESTYKQGAICFMSVMVSMWKVSNALPYGTIVSQRVATRIFFMWTASQAPQTNQPTGSLARCISFSSEWAKSCYGVFYVVWTIVLENLSHPYR